MNNGFRDDYVKSRPIPSKKRDTNYMPRLQGVSMQGASSPLTDWINSDVKTAKTVSIILIIFGAWAGIEAFSNVAGIAIPPETGMATNVDPDDTQRVNNGIIVALGSIALSVGIMLQLLIPRNLTNQKEMASEEPIAEEEKEEFDEELVKLTKWLSARGTTTVQFFEWADVDNSGTIDMNEFADAMRTAEIANLPPWEVGDLVKVMDINNDGKINLPELDMMVLKIRNSLGIEFIPYVEEEKAEEEGATEEAPEEAPAVETEEVVEEATEEEELAAVEQPEPVAEEVAAVEPEPVEVAEEVVEEVAEAVAEEVPAVEPEATVEEAAVEVVEETPEPVVEEVVEEVSEEEKAATLQAAQELLNSTLGVDDEEEESNEESDEDDSEEPIDQAAALSAAQDVLTNSLGLESEDEDSETEDEEEVVDEVEEEAAEEAQEEIEEPVEEKEPPKKKKKF